MKTYRQNLSLIVFTALLVSVVGTAHAAQNGQNVQVSFQETGQTQDAPLYAMDDMWMNWSDHMDRMVRHFNRFMHETEETESFQFIPRSDVIQKDNQLFVSIDLPGLKKEDIHIEIEDDLLKIHGERANAWEESKDEEGVQFYRSSKNYGRFLRTLQLPEEVDPEKIEATYENGVLEITMGLTEKKTKESIKVAIQ